jgi:hypothetical protein
MSTTESPTELRKRIRETEKRIEHLEGVPDPGSGLPPAEARTRRDAQIAELEVVHDELSALRAAWKETSPQEVEKKSIAERLRYLGRTQAARELHTPEANALIRESSEALHEKERERTARRRLAELRERRANPPDPRAASILAAVAADDILLSCLEHRFRPVEGQEGQTATSVLSAADIGVLLVTLRLLGERNPLRFQGWASATSWPWRDPRIAPAEGLRDSLRELRRLGFLDITVTGDTASVSYGTRVKEIAARWNIVLADPHTP